MEKIQELLKNKTVMYAAIGVVAVLLFLIIGMVIYFGTKPKDNAQTYEKVINEPFVLFTTDNPGKAIEVQALLARENIVATRKAEGSKTTLSLEKYTPSQRDQALLTIVSSGLMDQYVGLEIFDKGDFTSTKDDKRIRLVRAINGELSRLIRKIKPIENASVFISIPEQTMFQSDKKPITATVQIVIPSGTKLERTKVKAIENLLLGSVAGLTAENIAITDTNGNVYNSIINAADDQLAKLQENDQYMQSKVASQLDKLIGKGNYVVTVSTFLRQVPQEKTTISYDPSSRIPITEQTFSEGLGDQTRDSNAGLNAVSVYLPNGLPAAGSDSSQNRSYSRTAREVNYGVGKIHTSEFSAKGTVEDISIAVTLDSSAMPANVTLDELKELIARAASPKVKAENVTIAYSDAIDPYLASDKPVNLPKPDESGNPWWLTVALVVLGLIFGFLFVSKKLKKKAEEQQQEVDALRQKSAEQEKQLREVNLKASQLIEKQAQFAQGLMEQQALSQQVAAQITNQQNAAPAPQLQTNENLQDVLDDVRADIIQNDSDELVEQVKSWIEKA
ncbi:MAG: flagellar M-ring protein FliF C-terminal domain-containing protein [Candidatus Gastranaerophilaceae bacterium]